MPGYTLCFLCLSLSVLVSLYISVFFCLCLSLALSLYLCFSFRVCLSLPLPLSSSSEEGTAAKVQHLWGIPGLPQSLQKVLGGMGSPVLSIQARACDLLRMPGRSHFPDGRFHFWKRTASPGTCTHVPACHPTSAWSAMPAPGWATVRLHLRFVFIRVQWGGGCLRSRGIRHTYPWVQVVAGGIGRGPGRGCTAAVPPPPFPPGLLTGAPVPCPTEGRGTQARSPGAASSPPLFPASLIDRGSPIGAHL